MTPGPRPRAAPESRRLRHHLILCGLLAEKNLSYQQFADAIGCTKGYVANLCTGRRTSVGEQLAERVITVLEIHPAQLFVDAVSPNGGQDPATKDAA